MLFWSSPKICFIVYPCEWVYACVCMQSLSGVAGFCMTSSHQCAAGTPNLRAIAAVSSGNVSLHGFKLPGSMCWVIVVVRFFFTVLLGIGLGSLCKQAGALLLNHTPALLEKFHKVCLSTSNRYSSVFVFLGYFCILGEQFSWMCQTWLMFFVSLLPFWQFEHMI